MEYQLHTSMYTAPTVYIVFWRQCRKFSEFSNLKEFTEQKLVEWGTARGLYRRDRLSTF